MSESKTYIFGSDGMSGENGIWGLLGSLMQKSGVDPNLLLALRNGDGFGGNSGSWFLWILVLLALFRNGFGIGGGSDCISSQIANGQGRDLLMQAMNGNSVKLSELATMLNCNVGQLQTAINQVMSQVQSVGAQNNLSFAQTINAVQSGNAAVISALQNCCCDVRESITKQGYENQLATAGQTNTIVGRIDQLANGITQGFSATAYETAQQTCALQNGMKDNTASIIAKLDAIENGRKDREIETLKTELSQQRQNLTFGQMIAQAVNPLGAAIAALQSKVDSYECKLPKTVTVPANDGVLIPSCVAWNYGLNTFGIGPLGSGGGFL